MSDSRNLVIGFDGTWNEPQQTSEGEPAPTNVVKFMRAMKKPAGRMRRYYDKGVGTRAWESLPGGIVGYGLDKRVLGGYRFLHNCFRDAGFSHDQNKIFVIGFSRGAYTARRLAGLVNHCGLPKNSSDLELGLEIYREKNTEMVKSLKKSGRFFDIGIEMVGVWDTVKATNDPDYNDDLLPGCVNAGYHAIAIDEKRKSFPILRWKNDARALQNWFAGVHSDVGGGYANPGLSDIALKWMIYRANSHGLDFKKSYLDNDVDPRPDSLLHTSHKGIWKALGTDTRTILARDFVHRSVAERLDAKDDYHPANLPAKPRYWPPARG